MGLRNKQGKIKGVKFNVQQEPGADWKPYQVIGSAFYSLKGTYQFYLYHELEDSKTSIEVTLSKNALINMLEEIDRQEESRASKIAENTLKDDYGNQFSWTDTGVEFS